MKTPTAKKLPSGAWFCRVRIDGQDIGITRPTEKAAVAEAMAIKAGLRQAQREEGRDKTLTKAIDAYIEARENILSPSTIRGYRMIQKWRFQTMMPRRLGTVTAAQWQQAVNRESRLCSAKTLTNAWRFISGVIFDTTGQRINVTLPQIVPNERPYLTPDEIPTFVQAVQGTSVEIPALLALSSLRRSELLNLRWADIDMEKRILHVNGAAVHDMDGNLVRKSETKNKTSRRTVPIIPPLYDAMSQAERTGEYIVTMTPGAIYKAINRICEKNGLPKVGLHGLRHSFASLAYHLNMPEKIAMQIGGWANDQTMRRIYTHIAENDIAAQAESFAAFFSQNGNENGNDS